MLTVRDSNICHISNVECNRAFDLYIGNQPDGTISTRHLISAYWMILNDFLFLFLNQNTIGDPLFERHGETVHIRDKTYRINPIKTRGVTFYEWGERG